MSPATHAEYPGRVARPNSPMSPWQSKPSSSGPLPWLFPEVANLNSKMLGQLGGLAGGQEKHGYLYTQLQHQKWSILFCDFSSVNLTHTGPIFVCISFQRFVSKGSKSSSCFHHCYMVYHGTFQVPPSEFSSVDSSLTKIQMAVAQQKKQCTMLFPVLATSSNQSSLHMQCIASENPPFLFAC